MILNFSLDSSVSSAPVGFTAVLNSVASFFDNLFSDPVTINIAVGYGEVNNQPLPSGALGASSSNLRSYSYSQIRSAFVADAKSATDSSVVASLPTTDPTGGGHYWVTTAEAKALGLLSGTSTDGAIGFNGSFDYDLTNGITTGQYDFFGVVTHEVSEILGRQLLVGASVGGTANSYEPMDLLHFASPGVRTFLGTQAGYFSPDNGTTNLDNFNTNPSGDFGDWASSAGNDAANAFSFSGVVNAFTQADIKVMDALGWDLAADTTAPLLSGTSPADNSTNVAVGSNLVLTFNESVKAGSGNLIIHNASDGSTVASIAITDSSQVNFSGSTVTINPTSDLAAGAHYYVTIASGAIQDLAGNPYAGISSSTALDFTTATITPVETFGATTLATSMNHFYMLDSTGAGPSLKADGADVLAGEYGGWAPIGAEKTATGYEVAWKNGGLDQYTLWSTDNNGAYAANIVGTVSGANSTLQSSEILFHQDLNGDGVIGVPSVTTPIETFGATTLATSMNHFYMLDSTGAGPSLKADGADVLAGEYGGWAPIGAEKTATGYEVAWKNGGLDQYTLWSTDNNGAYAANIVGTVPGANSTLQSSETLFHQDLNGDGVIGVPSVTPPTPIETSGATTLATSMNHFYMLDSTGAGPSLKADGADVLAGEYGGWAPIGAEKTATGYEVAWKNGGLDQYTLWSTDNNGVYTANIVGTVPGANSTLQSSEILFQQDLNGDGHIGTLGAQMAAVDILAASSGNIVDGHHDWLL